MRMVAVTVLAAALLLPVTGNAQACFWPFVSAQTKEVDKSKPLVRIWTPDQERGSRWKRAAPVASILGSVFKVAAVVLLL